MNKKKFIWQIIYPLLIFFGVEFLIELIVAIFYLIPKIKESINIDEFMKLTTEFIHANSLYISIVRGVILIPLFAFIMKNDAKNNVTYNKWTLLLFIPIGLCAAIGFNGIISISGIEKFSKEYKRISEVVYNGNIFVQIFAAAIIAPIMEELLFRGLIYNRLKCKFKIVWSILFSSIIFGVIHGNIVQFIYAFLLGILLAYIYERYKTIWAPIIMHITANFSSIMITNYLKTYKSTILISIISLISTFLLIKIVNNNSLK